MRWGILFAWVLLSGCGERLLESQTLNGGRILGDIAFDQNANTVLGYPQSTQSVPEVLISRSQYVISWNEATRDINWAAWRLERSDIGRSGRSAFHTDDELARYLAGRGHSYAVNPKEYSGTCFDRGHKVPSGDRTDSEANNSATFSMVNITPEAAFFDQVTWASLEAYQRNYVLGSKDKLYIFAGPIFAVNPSHIGPRRDIAVPAKYFKIIVKEGHPQPEVVAAVIMPNLTSTGTDPATDRKQACADQKGDRAPVKVTWQSFSVPIAQIEQESHFDFSFLGAEK